MTEGIKPLQASGPYDRSRVKAGIAHMSVGNFHRSHQAWYVDRCLALPGHEGWGILGIGLLDVEEEKRKARELRDQKGLYSLTIFPPDDPSEVTVVGSIVEYLHAPDDPEAVLVRLSDPAIRIVTLTITEGGYNLDQNGRFKLEDPLVVSDLVSDRPRTVFGFLVEALRRRRQSGAGAFTILSCDNLRHNGNVLRTALLAFAHAKDAELAAWIERHVTFPSCMVDRITPSVGPAERERLNAASGYDDQVPVFAEDFVQWVIEDNFCVGRPEWEKVGVQFTDNVDPYEQVKIRMLNASHSVMAYPSVLIGHRLVHDAAGDTNIRALLEQFLHQDAAPFLQPPAGLSTRTYGETLLHRYSNRAIGDQLLRIASGGMFKLPVFLKDTAQAIFRSKRDHRRIAFTLAAFTEYLKGRNDAGEVFPVNEPNFDQTAADLVSHPDVSKALQLELFKGWEISESASFVAEYVRFRESIQVHGAGATLKQLLAEG